MKLHSKPKIVSSRNKRLGLGYGSGKGGHTSSRGQKGQKSRNHVRLSFTGSSWVWFKRLPFMRGKSRFNSFGNNVTINLSALNRFAAGTVVTAEMVAPQGCSPRLVATGKLTKKLTIQFPASKGAITAVEAAGGVYRAQTE